MIEAGQNAMGQPQFGVAPQGWQCPICKRVWNPNVQHCLNPHNAQVGPATAGLDPFDGRKNAQGSPFKDTYL